VYRTRLPGHQFDGVDNFGRCDQHLAAQDNVQGGGLETYTGFTSTESAYLGWKTSPSARLGLGLSGLSNYDPKLGRFLTEDLARFDNETINLYVYVRNCPNHFVDPLGLYSLDDFIYDSAQFSAGMGDNLSFNITSYIRDGMGTNQFIDKNGGTYIAGEVTGTILDVAIGTAGGVAAAGTKGAGKEFSHWIPGRYGKKIPAEIPDSLFNGNYVTKARHYFHDPYRFPVKNSRKVLGPKWPRPVQQIDRIPNALKGPILGAAAGSASMYYNYNHDCP